MAKVSIWLPFKAREARPREGSILPSLSRKNGGGGGPRLLSQPAGRGANCFKSEGLATWLLSGNILHFLLIVVLWGIPT